MRDVGGILVILGAAALMILFIVFLVTAMLTDDWAQATFWLLCLWIACSLLLSRRV